MRSEPESNSQPNNYSFHHKTKKLQKNIQVRQKQTKKQRIMDVVSGTLLPTYITISLCQTDVDGFGGVLDDYDFKLFSAPMLFKSSVC
jgi:hypothetical protein